MSSLEGFGKVRDGRFAFFCEEPIANRIIHNIFEPHEICEIRRVYFRRNELAGIIVKKYLPIRERFFINFLWMKEVGIVYKINHYWNKIELSCESNGHFDGVRLEYLATIFMFLLFAQILSIIILIYEIRIEKYAKCKIQNRLAGVIVVEKQ